MAERCALFIIISLGEGILVTGATFAELEPSGSARLAFLSAFVASVAMRWIYFDIGARRGSDHIEHDERPGLIGRDAYTYAHIPIVAGIIVLAVANEQVLDRKRVVEGKSVSVRFATSGRRIIKKIIVKTHTDVQP